MSYRFHSFFSSAATVTSLSLLASCGGSESAAVSHSASGGNASSGAAATDIDSPIPRAPVDSGSILAAMDGSHRSDANRARDAARHPKETLEFFGIESTMTVVELWPGGGWYTEILAPYLRREGQLRAAIPAAEGRRARYRTRFTDKMQGNPELYDAVELVTLDAPETVDLGPAASADMVLTFRNSHNWMGEGTEEAVYRAAFETLKSGGVFGVVQHRAPASEDTPRPDSGYVPQSNVIQLAEGIGFVLESSSEINANENDTTVHPNGVWSLPPVLRGGDENREAFLAIGESDRMTLRFRKP